MKRKKLAQKKNATVNEVRLTSRVEKALRQHNLVTSAVRPRNVNVVVVISDKYTTFKPSGQDF